MWFWLTILILCLVVGLGVEMFAGHVVGSIMKDWSK